MARIYLQIKAIAKVRVLLNTIKGEVDLVSISFYVSNKQIKQHIIELTSVGVGKVHSGISLYSSLQDVHLVVPDSSVYVKLGHKSHGSKPVEE